MRFLHACVPANFRGQKRFPEMELNVVISCHVGAL